jgi:hypothetical protein
VSARLDCPLCGAVVAEGVADIAPGVCPGCGARYEGGEGSAPDAVRTALLGFGADALDLVVYYELPYLRAERVLHSQFRFAPRGWRSFPRAIRALFGAKLWVENAIGDELGYDGPVLLVPHHAAHAASAYPDLATGAPGAVTPTL